jgi:hypothetical protein
MSCQPKRSYRTQIECFCGKAGELGADEDDAALREKLRVIARQKPIEATRNENPRESEQKTLRRQQRG